MLLQCSTGFSVIAKLGLVYLGPCTEVGYEDEVETLNSLLDSGDRQLASRQSIPCHTSQLTDQQRITFTGYPVTFVWFYDQLKHIIHTHTNIHLTAFFQDNLGKPAPER